MILLHGLDLPVFLRQLRPELLGLIDGVGVAHVLACGKGLPYLLGNVLGVQIRVILDEPVHAGLHSRLLRCLLLARLGLTAHALAFGLQGLAVPLQLDPLEGHRVVDALPLCQDVGAGGVHQLLHGHVAGRGQLLQKGFQLGKPCALRSGLVPVFPDAVVVHALLGQGNDLIPSHLSGLVQMLQGEKLVCLRLFILLVFRFGGLCLAGVLLRRPLVCAAGLSAVLACFFVVADVGKVDVVPIVVLGFRDNSLFHTGDIDVLVHVHGYLLPGVWSPHLLC